MKWIIAVFIIALFGFIFIFELRREKGKEDDAKEKTSADEFEILE